MFISGSELIAGNEIIVATALILGAFVLIVITGRIVSWFIKPALKLELHLNLPPVNTATHNRVPKLAFSPHNKRYYLCQ